MRTLLFRESGSRSNAPRRSAKWRWGAAAILGLLGAVTYISHFVPEQALVPAEAVFLWIYLAVFFALLAYWSVFRLAGRRRLARGIKLAWALGALAAGVLLVLLLPIQPPPLALQHRLEIVATGQKAPNAKRAEVWVTGLYRADGSQVPVAEFSQQGAWEIFDTVVASRQQQPATLRWEGALKGDARLVFASNVWTGKVRVTWDDQSQTFDLYTAAEQPEPKSLPLPGATPAAYTTDIQLQEILVQVADSVSIGTLVFIAGAWLMMLVARARPADRAR